MPDARPINGRTRIISGSHAPVNRISSLLARCRSDESFRAEVNAAVEAHKNDPTDYGRFTVPADDGRSRLERVVDRFNGAIETDSGYQVCCPIHDDSTPSLSISERPDGLIRLYCHAGCNTGEILEAVGLKFRDVMADNPQAETTYDYKDASGKLVFQVVRSVDANGKKKFRPRQPKDGGGWINSVKDLDAKERYIPYRLPELLADPTAPVWIVEGEKDADNLAALGLVATCNAGGAGKGKWRAEHAAFLRGRVVYIVPDHDDPGRTHAAMVAESLAGVAASVRVVELLGLNGEYLGLKNDLLGLAPKGADVSDWLAAGGTKAQLLAIAANPPEQAAGNNQVFQVSDFWGEPVLIESPSDLPEFPVACLPERLAEWVTAVAESTQTPVALAGMLSLAAVSIAVAKKIEVQPKPDDPGYVEPANVYVCVPLGSGNRKTAVVNKIKAPFNGYLKQYTTSHGPALAVARQELKALEKKQDRLTNQLSTAEGDAYTEIKAELQECIKQIGQTDTYIPRFFADDVTSERLVMLMSEHRGRMAILSDEGGCFDHFAGIYRSQPNLEVYLHAHSGGTVYRDRQLENAETCVEEAALTIGVTPQPQVLEGLGSKDRLQGRGLLARFLFAFPKSLAGSRDWESGPVPDKAEINYTTLINTLLGWNPKKRVRIKFSNDAYGRWLAFVKRNEPRFAPEGDFSSPGIAEWANKLSGAVARIATLLHCASDRHFEPEVDLATMQRAIQIAEYLIPHARQAFKVLRTDPATEAARVLQNWVVKQAGQGETRFSKSKAHQSHKSRFPNVSDMDKPLQILLDRQICRPEATETKGRGRPSVHFEINPALVVKTQT